MKDSRPQKLSGGGGESAWQGQLKQKKAVQTMSPREANPHGTALQQQKGRFWEVIVFLAFK